MRLSTALSLLCVAAFAITATGGTSAFAWASTERAASAAIVGDLSAYNAITMLPCIASTATGGTCSFDITNHATTPQSYTVTKEEDLGGAVTAFRIDSGPLGLGPMTSSEVSPPSGSIRVTAEITGCAICSPKDVYWTVEGNKANVITTKETRIQMTITYG